MKKLLKSLIKKILKKNNWKLEKIVQPRDYNLKAPEEVMLSKIRNSKGILHVGAHRGSEAPVYVCLINCDLHFLLLLIFY